MSQTRFETWHLDLQDLLGLAVPPVAIAFISHVPAGIAPYRTNHAAGNGGWPDGSRCRELRLLDRGHAGRVRDGGGGPRQLQRRQPHAWLQEHGGDRPQCGCRCALRDRMGHAGSGGKDRGRTRKADKYGLWTVARHVSRAVSHPAAAEWKAADAAARCVAGPSLRRQTAMSHHSDRQRERRDRRERRLHAEPRAYRHVE